MDSVFAAQDPEMRPKITLQQEAEPVDSIEHYTRLLEPSLWWELVGKLGVADGNGGLKGRCRIGSLGVERPVIAWAVWAITGG